MDKLDQLREILETKPDKTPIQDIVAELGLNPNSRSDILAVSGAIKLAGYNTKKHVKTEPKTRRSINLTVLDKP